MNAIDDCIMYHPEQGVLILVFVDFLMNSGLALALVQALLGLNPCFRGLSHEYNERCISHLIFSQS